MNPDMPERDNEPKNDPDAASDVAAHRTSAQTKQRSVAEYAADAHAQGVTNCGCAVQK
jgi:hypothetical protein